MDAKGKEVKVTNWSLDIGVGENPRGNINLDVIRTKYCNLVADAHNLPFKSNVFEKIYCSELLEHLDDPSKALEEINRVLHTNGVALIDFPKPFVANLAKGRLIHFILNFPFDFNPKYMPIFFESIRGIKRREPRWFHKYIVTPEFVKKRLRVATVEAVADILFESLNYGRKARYFRWKPKVYSAYLLTCKKRL